MKNAMQGRGGFGGGDGGVGRGNQGRNDDFWELDSLPLRSQIDFMIECLGSIE